MKGKDTTATAKGDGNKNKKSIGQVAKKNKLVKNISESRNQRKKMNNEDEKAGDMTLKQKQKIWFLVWGMTKLYLVIKI